MQKKKLITGVTLLLLIVGATLYIFIHEADQANLAEKDIKQQDAATKEKTANIKKHEQKPSPKLFIHKEQQVTKHFYQSRHITAIGDSLTQGVGDETKQGGYVGALEQIMTQANTEASFDNFGVRGNRSDQLLKRLQQDDIIASIKQADIVFITIGANDVMRVLKENITNLQMEAFEKARVDYEKRLHKILTNIRTVNADTKIYLLGFYNPFGQYFKDIKELKLIADNWNKTGKEIITTYENSSFIPISDLFSNTDENLFAEDNFHPNQLGYERIAERIFEVLKNEQERG
ncbi:MULTISPECIES: SGNH/GDSL hydrolase family protein [Virgibacillus]|uniref:Spore germination lipase LipC n=1 Tax=Virgibacillus dokdonensis TaxID=302167 RepID=A0A2K9IZ12_9BACI|nr:MULTISPECIES: SGNH/GDSL hydrolase family protein [Virgibacillus]AUJ24929.1 Spore germination lipase LipC [Virgibacillus dokdonensis]NWO12098.1 SGNH/GDSL hydrolase family protein [Virgibacillus sp.]